MSLKACWRIAPDRQICRYVDRLSDPECHRCALAIPAPPQRKAGAWFNYRAELAEIRKEVAHRPIQPDKGTPE